MIEQSIQQRCMTTAEAAAYCSLSPSGFRSRVARGLLPKPLPGTHRWDRKAIDAALDKHSGLESDEPETAYDRWRRQRDARRA